MTRPASYSEFWPCYVRQHRSGTTRWLHFAGTAASLAFLAGFLTTWNAWLLLGVPLSGYGLAWLAHAAVERNRPATWSHPLWSMVADLHMFGLMILGRMGREVERHRHGPVLAELDT